MAGKSAERRDERERHVAAFVVGALLGGVAGAAWTLFHAPRSGAETRAAIAKSVTAAVDQVRDSVRAAGERVADRLALTFDALAGGESADTPGPLGDKAASRLEASGATAASPTAVDGSAAPEEPAAVPEPAAAATLAETAASRDSSEVEQPAGAAPAGTTS